MSLTLLTTIAVLLLTLPCIALMLYKRWQIQSVAISAKTRAKLIITGVLSFISDTVGIGSFAVLTALEKAFNLCEDHEMPGLNNGAQIIPGMLASIFFMQLIEVDYITLVTLVAGACVGGLIGGSFVTRLSEQKIRLGMIMAFSGIIILLFMKQLGYFPEAGTVTALSPLQLIIGFFGMIFCGSLTSIGIGAFAAIQAVLFLLKVSPAIAFPIMTTAGAMQQPITTMIFLKRDKVPLQKALIIGLSGCVGVFIALPIISHLNTQWLHHLLLLIMIYNIGSISLTYRLKKQTVAKVLQPGPT